MDGRMKKVTFGVVSCCLPLRLAQTVAFSALPKTKEPLNISRSVLVIRHGETDWNNQRRVQGTTDIPLNERGINQASACAGGIISTLHSTLENGHSKTPLTVYTSCLKRARDTGFAIARSIQAELCTDSRLNEWDLGNLEGMTKADAAAKCSGDWDVFKQWCNGAQISYTDAAKHISGNGESMDDVRQRSVACIENLIEQAPDDESTIVVVTHGGVLGQLLRHATMQNKFSGNCHFVYRKAQNACISHFTVSMTESGGKWDIVTWADTSHLVGDAKPISAQYGSTA
eukprot:CAMPEP_0113303422 /NCGR_PEP_ID=MMETSP0010_2-20120614/3847_1 /TAXON_ID=216773 ORGANISM="Corethron hystrix, Strain 308" /NCGR_SAMPLE_ID=MMETSP0010_2 /ASSEMBLY_ACC=CAM_ASM_000155 /LENGTH=285 /DNA_ID=CAMNT_0000157421 /DNA_START=173 /DNA_END=1030 /DNA_ORIENTATION=- /assembly_acc=CAM_ASM_000155